MERTFETRFGEVTLRNVMIEQEFNQLVEGIEIKLDGVVIGEAYGDDSEFDFYDDEYVTIEMVEDYAVEFADIDKL